MPSIQEKRGAAAALAATNPVLRDGEVIYETDTRRFKIGDGSTAWNLLSYAVLPSGSRGDITVSSDGQSLTIASGAVTDAKVNDVAATKLTGTLADARLSSNVLLTSALASRQHQTTSLVDCVDRNLASTSASPVSGAQYWTFFTPTVSMTISQIAFASGGGATTGATLIRFGLYTADASGNCTLVARTASDTTIFAAANTTYTRSLDTTGGYPASYSLVAGTRYAVSVVVVATGVNTIVGALVNSTVAALSPRVQGVRTGANDLVTSQTSGQYNGSVNQAYWARLS